MASLAHEITGLKGALHCASPLLSQPKVEKNCDKTKKARKPGSCPRAHCPFLNLNRERRSKFLFDLTTDEARGFSLHGLAMKNRPMAVGYR
jgi:hypothetical protein